MDIKDIITLIQTVSDSKLSSFEYQEGDTRLAFQIERETAVNPAKTVVMEEIDQNTVKADTEESTECNYITSPMVLSLIHI